LAADHHRILEAAEACAATGGVYLVPTWDTTVADHPFLSVMYPSAAIPEFRFGRLRAVTLWTVVDQDRGVTWRHVERHEPGVVLHGLYRGDKTTLGIRVGLADRAQTAGLAEEVRTADWGITGTLAQYVPNRGPNRWLIGHPTGQHCGYADTRGHEDT